MDNLLTAKQVQELLNVDRTTIYRMLKDGRLSGVKVGQHWRFPAREVDEFLAGNFHLAESTESLSIENPLPLHCIQPVQDVFAEIAQVGSVTTDKDGVPLTHVSNACDFCKLILGSDEGHAACIASWKKLVDQKDTTPEFTTCHAGLQYARARIKGKEKLMGILVAGQFYVDEPEAGEEAQRIEEIAQKYHIDPNLLKQASDQISVLDERKTRQIGGWLERVAKTFEQISSERTSLIGRLKQIAEMSVIE